MSGSPQVAHEFDWPDRVVIGTVGMPGERTFYLQVRSGRRSAGVVLEKEQSAALAEKVDELLDVVAAGSGVAVPATASAELVDDAPLDMPVDEEFRVGTLRLGWDPRTAQVVIEAYPFPEPPDDDGDDAAGPAEALVGGLLIRIPVGAARAFAERTRRVVGAGRPTCPACGEPVDPTGHACAPPGPA